MAQDFDGTNDEGDIPDNDDFSFGDGATDQPFSIVALVNPDVVTGSETIVAKYDEGTGAATEWFFYRSGALLRCLYYDDSASEAYIGRGTSGAQLVAGQWMLVGSTYDGSAVTTGIRLYADGARVDDTNVTSGTYTAMENLGETLSIGHDQANGSDRQFWDGKMALILLVANQLSEDQMWSIKTAVNSYFDLSL